MATGTRLARFHLSSISHANIPPFLVILIPSLAPTSSLQLQIHYQSAQLLQLLVSLVKLLVP